MAVRPPMSFPHVVTLSAVLALQALIGVARLHAQGPPPPCQTGCPGYGVTVGPHGGHEATPLNATDTVTFQVVNEGTSSDTYQFACWETGGVGCVSVTPSGATVAVNGWIEVQVVYTVGATTGEVHLTATGHAMDEGWFVVDTAPPPTITLVVPTLTSGSRAVVRNRQPMIRALFAVAGGHLDTTRTQLKWRGDSTVTTLARANRGLLEWDVDSTRWLGIGDSALIEVRACTLEEGACATATRWAVLPNDDKPVLGFSGMPIEALGRVFSAPFGPGLSVSGGDVETGLGTPAYVSMGAPRSAGLVYSTRQSYPRALVPVDLELTWPAGTPDQIKLVLQDGVTKLDSVVLASPTCATGAARRCRAALQADFSASTFATPTRKWLTVEAQVTAAGTTKIASDSVEVVLVDRRSTPYGSGWWPAGILKVVAAGSDRLLIGPSGAAAIYRGNGDSVYLSPPGDFSILNVVAGGWELSPRGSPARLVFDASGRLVRALDANGNKDSVVYNGASDQVTSLRDPVGKTIALAYDGNGKLSTLTDPGGRQTRVAINGTTNQLTYDSLPSLASRPYTSTFVYQTYPGTNTVVLTKRIGVIADTTVVTYDSTFRRRPSQVTLPEVRDENGNAVKPVITYIAAERQGVGGLRSLDSAYVELRDPRNNWTRSLVNRWGQPRRTWDALGLLGRSEYTGEGFPVWAEGKNGDSSRVYTRYDALRRPVRTYILRSLSDTLKLDSLVYDTNHRVIATVDARGKRDSIVYDANGNVSRTITPNNDTTKFWYRSDGLIDSTRAPGMAARRFTYDSVWGNLARVLNEAGQIADSAVFDGLGRTSSALSRVRVQVTTTSSVWQWRRRETFYNAAGQIDSTRISRTANCSGGCPTPPAWPAPSDTLRTQRVGYRFDRAGRDSLRLNDRGVATLYLYDRLGRVLSRRPWTDSMAVKDSFVYDIAGNVKRTITRRGDVIVSNYDTRNRDTLTAVPGVGDLRRAFGGPLDQVTRLWFDNFVDSIGGVNPAVASVYDQRGRLKSDTSFTGAIARPTTYTYDGFERPSTTTDPMGAWAIRYEASRGYADTLITPFADTVTYSFDAQERAVGPTIKAGTLGVQRTPTWNGSGALQSLSNAVLSPAFDGGSWSRNDVFEPDLPDNALIPKWVGRQGAGATPDSLQDSVSYDGWERVTAWVEFTNGMHPLFRDSVWYDRTGNTRSFTKSGPFSSYGNEVYDPTTDRLMSRVVGGATMTYAYDRAGNLVSASVGGTVTTYGYDALNRLRAVRQSGTLIARYSYDVLGRRIAKRVYGGSTGGTVGYLRFVYRGENVGYETDSLGQVNLRYTWGPAADDLLAIRDSLGNHYYVVQDKLHSVRGVVKRDGTWVGTLSYRADGRDGETGLDPGDWLRYRWTGREYDRETGFYFHRARYYDPGVGRFVQEDPIGYAGGGNLYAYAGGNLLEARDPSGMMSNNELMWAPKLNPSCGQGTFNGATVSGCSGMGTVGGLSPGAGGFGPRNWSPRTTLERMAASLGCIGKASCAPSHGVLELVYRSVTSSEAERTSSLRIVINGIFLTESGYFKGQVSGDGQTVDQIIEIRVRGQLKTQIHRLLLGDFDLENVNEPSRWDPSTVYRGWVDLYTEDYIFIFSGQVEGIVTRRTNTGVFWPYIPLPRTTP